MRGRQPRKSRLCSAELRLIQQVQARTPKPAAASQQATAVTSVAGKTGDVALTKADVGLPNVENTSITAAIAAHAATPHGGTAAWADITGKPSTFPPEAHGDHLTMAQAAAAAPVQSVAGRTGAVTLAKGDVGLGNCDNTSDASKPISTAVQAALDGKAAAGHDHAGAYEVAGAIASHAAAADPHPGYLTQTDGDARYALAGQGGSGPWTVLKKTADTGRTNNTLSNDPDLAFTMNGSAKYLVRGRVFFDTNATADFKWRHVGPTLPTLVRINRDWIIPGGTAYAGIAVDQAFSAADLAVLTAGTNGGVITFEGIVHVGVTGGTFAFAWAQNTTNVGAATVRAGSYLEYMTV